MKLGIMQPYFFPYLGYFDLIHATDRFILFDSAQYIRHGWVNRNRILHPTQGWKYILVPLAKHSQITPICQICVHAQQDWRQKILGQLDHYRKRAPYFQFTRDLVRDVLVPPEESLSRINARSLELVCQALGIRFQVEYFSEMGLELSNVNEPGDWALEISRALGATTYINPVGGEAIFEPHRFREASIELILRPFENLKYEPRGYEFQPALSIIDVLMWNSPSTIKAYLETRQDRTLPSADDRVWPAKTHAVPAPHNRVECTLEDRPVL